MATRDGAERVQWEQDQQPATEQQKKLVAQIVRDFPLSCGMFEYEDYQTSPTQGNASDFITRALEENFDRAAKRKNYIQYIANRPHAQRIGAHGLFTSADGPLTLSQVAEAVSSHPGTVWLPIISLRREDAARLGYDNAESWRNLLSSYAMEMAQGLKIPWEDFRWYAAFHNESHHPHIHMVCYSADPTKGFLTKQGIADIKSGLAKEIFRNELTELYRQQTQRRDTLNQDAETVMQELLRRMEDGTADNPRMEELMTHLADRLRFTSGKKQYGYLKAPLKAVVDEIVDELAKDPRVTNAYDLWYQMREEVLRTYRNDLPERLPLSQQKEFKRIKNMVIQEATRLGELNQVFQPEENVQEQHEKDEEQSPNKLERLRQAAERGNPSAQYHLGKLLLQGNEIPKDAKLTNFFFKKQEDIRPLFQSQLEACGVDYFDFYLMHAQGAATFAYFKQCRAYETALELKAEGKIRHFGISFHDRAEVLEQILTEYPQVEVVQIQFNYLDYEDPAVESRKCYEVCRKYGKPVIVMEPVKGGTLANLPELAQAVLDELGGGSAASYAIRYAAGFDGMMMVLSGMSSMDQMVENISFMKDFRPLDDKELDAIDKVREIYHSMNLIPCTACRYCVAGCPKHISIPDLLAVMNTKQIHHDWNADYYYNVVHTGGGKGKASDCIQCGKCEKACPQHLPIRKLLVDVAKEFEK